MTPEEMAEAIGQAIREGVLKPGQAMVQDDLASTFGVSRVPVREALRILSGEGLVTMLRSQGAIVTRLDLEEVQELYALRLQMEPPLAPFITARCSDLQLSRLAKMVERMKQVGKSDTVTWSNLNYDFHRTMYVLSERPHTLRLITQVLNLVETYSRLYVHHLHALDRVHEEHDQMIEALHDRDPDRLARYITLHLEGAREGLAEAMADEDNSDVITALGKAVAARTKRGPRPRASNPDVL